MATNVAIVDERDSLIHYVGPWNEAGAPSEFNGTTKWSATQGSTASFTFEGSSVTVFGTIAAKNSPQASLNFVVDNSITGTYTPPSNLPSDIHHEALWTSPTMSEGSHTIVITQIAAQTAGVIFLDYIMYNTSSSTVHPYFIDDRDPRIKYTAAWRKSGSDLDFQHTSQGSTFAGDSFSLQFEGKSISYYGGINNGSAGEVLNASMVIDGGPPIFFVPGIQPAAVTTNNLIFNSGDLSEGNHTLVVTAENDHTVWTDYFLVTPNTGLPLPSGLSAAPVTSQKSSKSTPVGVIVGLVIGGLIVIALGAAAILLCRRRHRRGLQTPEGPMVENIESAPAPQWRRSRAGGWPRPLSSEGHSPTISISTGPPLTSSGYSIVSPDAEITSPSYSVPQRNMTDVAPMPTGILPSNKLAREAERRNNHLQTRSGPPDGEDGPPGYSES